MTNQELIQEFIANGNDEDYTYNYCVKTDAFKNASKARVGKVLKNSNGTLRVQNGKLYSYDLLIAEFTGTDWSIHVHDYKIAAIENVTGYRSMTTRQHIGLLQREIEESLHDATVFVYEENDDFTTMYEVGKPSQVIA